MPPVGRLSEECEYFAYGLSSSGSDWVTVRFLKADDLTQLPDVLERVKFSCLAWTHDARGIFYNSYPVSAGDKADGEGQNLQRGSFYSGFCVFHCFATRTMNENLLLYFKRYNKRLSWSRFNGQEVPERSIHHWLQ